MHSAAASPNPASNKDRAIMTPRPARAVSALARRRPGAAATSSPAAALSSLAGSPRRTTLPSSPALFGRHRASAAVDTVSVDAAPVDGTDRKKTPNTEEGKPDDPTTGAAASAAALRLVADTAASLDTSAARLETDRPSAAAALAAAERDFAALSVRASSAPGPVAAAAKDAARRLERAESKAAADDAARVRRRDAAAMAAADQENDPSVDHREYHRDACAVLAKRLEGAVPEDADDDADAEAEQKRLLEDADRAIEDAIAAMRDLEAEARDSLAQEDSLLAELALLEHELAIPDPPHPTAFKLGLYHGFSLYFDPAVPPESSTAQSSAQPPRKRPRIMPGMIASSSSAIDGDAFAGANGGGDADELPPFNPPRPTTLYVRSANGRRGIMVDVDVTDDPGSVTEWVWAALEQE